MLNAANDVLYVGKAKKKTSAKRLSSYGAGQRARSRRASCA